MITSLSYVILRGTRPLLALFRKTDPDFRLGFIQLIQGSSHKGLIMENSFHHSTSGNYIQLHIKFLSHIKNTPSVSLKDSQSSAEEVSRFSRKIPFILVSKYILMRHKRTFFHLIRGHRHISEHSFLSIRISQVPFKLWDRTNKAKEPEWPHTAA